MPTAQEKLNKLTDVVELELKKETRRSLLERITALRIANKRLQKKLDKVMDPQK